MSLRFPIPVVVLGCCIASAGCDDRQAPTAPTVTSAGTIDTRSLLIVSGADERPVAGAAVRIGGTDYVTDAGGHPVGGEQYRPLDSDVDVVLDGYLRRETKASYGDRIVLWPAANELEMEAIRRMVYARNGSANEARRGFIAYPLTVSAEGLSDDGLRVWREVVAEVRLTLQVEVDFYTFFAYDPNEVNMRLLGNPPECTPEEWLDFCRDPNPFYVLYRMRRERASDPAAVKRLIFSYFLGANPLPGFMNAEAPAAALSPLELQTMRMMIQRSRTNRWPDSDR